MPIHDVLAFAKEHDVPMSAIKCNPLYDEKKGRVSKGRPVPHVGWNKKKRWEAKNAKKTITDEVPTMWFFDLKKAGMYVIDIDPKNGKTAQEALHPAAWTNLYECSEYIVETGSKGIHVYFKVPELEEGTTLADAVKIEGGESWFINGEGEVDVIVDHIIAEGSSYEFEGTKYSYISLKPGSSIHDVEEHPRTWEYVGHFVSTTPQQQREAQKAQERAQEEKITNEMNRTIEYDEVIDHINNIPNDTTNWNDWYKMAQIVYNVLGRDGLAVFNAWSSKNRDHDDRTTRDLWKGLSERHDGKTLTIGSLLFLSKSANEDNYTQIRLKYKPLSYASLKMMLEQDHFFVEEPEPAYVRQRSRNIVIYTPSSFREVIKTLDFQYTDKKGEIKTKSFYEHWSSDKSKRTYKRFGFYPNQAECPKDEYNRFVPAEATFQEEEKVDITPILNHFSVMSGHNQEGTDFLLNFFGQIVQQPGTLPGMAILLYAEEGAGKDILVDWIGQYVLGYHQYCKPGKIENMFKGFNSELVGKMLIHTDEVDNKAIKKYIEDLKRIITNGRIRIEGKGKDAVEHNSCTRLFMTTNNRDALVVSHSDRRFCIFESSSEHRQNINYFKTLHAHLKQPGMARAFYEFLMQRDLSNFDHTKRPKTALYKEMKQSSVNPILSWVANAEEDFEEPLLRTTSWLEKYNMWAERNKMRSHNITSFGTQMNELDSKKIGFEKKKPKNVSMILIKREDVMVFMEKEGLIDPVEETVEDSE